ncbi:2-phospho-L-lactate guanylyltransferase [Herbiconiux moechotypicola]|uniref:Phosphoenolpyruvate guanylyltransferase n=1 Tax=Herbiconiux moechotypicola TaxID=637393 RepID=A0ABP5QXR8_9MICO|nr:2-phospho-L-lactate guanylyltransferase [Herbiconiux moechotypicola]MCS5730900.1 2-phospho-L-lactate guanylyltransferase [Herbiconiux moechotypicola]
MESRELSWTVVVPVKGTADGKSRLDLHVPPDRRSRLADAFALDTVAAVLATPTVERVVVVTETAAPVAEALATLGADLVGDPGAGLNAAIRAGLSSASASVPAAGGLAVLLGDLPSLLPADLALALDLAAAHPLAVVADAEGTGTTLLAARGAVPVPRFGAGSAARHVEGGHVPLELPAGTTLRRDVDTAADLAQALAAGVGAHTAAALTPPAASGPSPRR